MAFKFKNGTSNEDEEETTSPAAIDGLDDLIETCTSCIEDIEEAVSEEDQADRDWDKITEQWPDPHTELSIDYDTWESLSNDEKQAYRDKRTANYLRWKENPERLKAVAAHRAKHPEWWSCFCGGY